MIEQTRNCAKFGHPEFRITFDKRQVPVFDDVQWLITWLEEAVAEGTRFLPGETCQIGWMINEIRKDNSGYLTLWEPDMVAMPVNWIEGSNHTLSHLRVQKDVVESVLPPSAIDFPSLRHSAIACSRLGKSKQLVLERVAPSGGISGWFIGCRDKDHDHNDTAELGQISLYEAAAQYEPRIIPYLALPSGVLVAIGDEAPAIFHHGELLDFRAGSYLAALYPAQPEQ